MPMKYIVLRGAGGELPVLFPRDYYHSQVAARFAPAEVVAAGFVHLVGGGPECFGGSSSLRIASRRDRDARLIATLLGGDRPPAAD
ncbi:MAG: hypothetical protein ACFCUO_04885 [Rhodospirillales bacterium]